MKRPLRFLSLLALAVAPGVAAAAAGGEPARQPSSPFALLVTLACFALLVWDVAAFPRRIYRGADLACDSKRLCAVGVAGFALIALQVVLFAVLSPIPPFSVHGGAPVSCRLRPDLPAALVFWLCLFARTPVRVPFGEETGTQVADVSSDAAPRRSGGFAAVACRLFEWGAAFTLMGAFAVSDMRRAVEPGLDWTQCFLVFVLPMFVQAVCLFGMSAAGIAALRLRVAVDGRPLAPAAAKFASERWPGALTLVLPCGDGYEGFRVPDHAWTRRLLARCGGALRVTSANLSGRHPATDAPQALADVGLSADMVVDDGVSPGGVPSTVVKVLPDGQLQTLRP